MDDQQLGQKAERFDMLLAQEKGEAGYGAEIKEDPIPHIEVFAKEGRRRPLANLHPEKQGMALKMSIFTVAPEEEEMLKRILDKVNSE